MRSCPHCKAPLVRARSPDDHRRFFALIHAAFHHWPEGHEFQPDDAEHLRAWLLCKAGYRDVTTIPVETDHPAVVKLAMLAAEAAVKAAKGYAFLRPHGEAIVVFSPKSLAFDKLDQKAFGPVREAVEQIVEDVIGRPADQIMRETERAA